MVKQERARCNSSPLLFDGMVKLAFENSHRFFSIGVHEVGDAGDFGTFLGEGHKLTASDGRDAETASPSHQLLQTSPYNVLIRTF